MFLLMLRVLLEKQKICWCDYLNKVVYVYNCICYDFIGFLLFYLLFGRILRLFIDLMFGLKLLEGYFIYLEYVRNW